MTFQDSYKLALDRVAAGDVTPLMLWPLGRFTSSKYKDLPLTRELADEVISNFSAGVLGTEPVVDSSGSHDTSAPAAAWVKRVYVAPTTDGGEAAFADVQWTDVGAQLVSNREYQYNSVELGPVVDNVTGEKTDNVLRSITLTNTPVLRMLASVLDAGDSIAASEPVEILCSEVALAPIPLFILESMRKKWRKANPDKDDSEMPANIRPKEDSGATAASEASSDPVPDAGKGEEGRTTVTLADGSAEQRGSESMKTVALKLNLSEDADESTILAEVVKLEERVTLAETARDEATAKLTESENAKKAAEVEAVMAKLMEAGNLTPGEREKWLTEPELLAGRLDARTGIPEHSVIKLGETGSGRPPADASDDPAVELDEAARKLAEERKVPYGEAMTLALAEDPALAERYHNRNL